MSAQRAETDEERKRAGAEAYARIRRWKDELRANNPDFTEEDWDRLADEWAEAVNDGIRRHVRRMRGEPETPSP